LGYDIFEKVRNIIPLDIAGMGSAELGGLGEIPHHKLPALMAKYSFLFNPIRYSSLGLTVCEAMMAGVPVLGLATTEMANIIKNGVNGYVDTDLKAILLQARMILQNETYARLLSAGAKAYARKRFAIERFAKEWETLFQQVAERGLAERKIINSGFIPPVIV
jgi:glycosyltransferase involved in cell wall biosynthesis